MRSECLWLHRNSVRLEDLLKELKQVVSKWENIGVMVGIASGILDNTEADNQIRNSR